MLTEEINKSIEIVKNDILKRFPNCSYTVCLNLWDDDTHMASCRHGLPDGKKVCISTYYNGELTYEEVDVKFSDGLMLDEQGNEYHRRK